jgi:hypothetical protein
MAEFEVHRGKAAVLIALRRWNAVPGELKPALELAERYAKEDPDDLKDLRNLAETCEDWSRFHYAKARAGITRAENVDSAFQYAKRASALWQDWEKRAVPSAYLENHKREISTLLAQIEAARGN